MLPPVCFWGGPGGMVRSLSRFEKKTSTRWTHPARHTRRLWDTLMPQMVPEKHDLIKIYNYALEVYFRVVPRFACFIAFFGRTLQNRRRKLHRNPKNV